MLELSKNNRIQFRKKGIQESYIIKVEKALGLTDSGLAQKLQLSRRTIWEWKKERVTMNYEVAKQMSALSKVPIPKDNKIINWNHHYQNAGRIGIKVKIARYGNVIGPTFDEEKRKEKWKEWWKNVGQYKKPAIGYNTLLKIKTPEKNKLLAEFIGVLLGDGHIADYQITITLSSEEKEYILYICKMIEKLFGCVPTIVSSKISKAVTIIVSRKSLVDFCQKVGFEKGNKVAHQVDIPEWITKNKTFSQECIRGLIDTDGCFFIHSYTVNGKKYSYLKIAFTSASVPLRQSVSKTLINLGFNVRMTKVRRNNNGVDVRIEDAQEVEKYIKKIGSHNKKHLDRIKKWKVAGAVNGTVC